MAIPPDDDEIDILAAGYPHSRARASSAQRRRPPGVSLSEGKILIVDDSELVLETTQLILESAGFEVATLTSPDTLPMAVLEERPDLILLDVSMPKLRGDRALQLNRERHHLRDVRVLLHSSRDAEELADLCRRSGADGYIVKGGGATELVELLRSWVARVRSGSAPRVAGA